MPSDANRSLSRYLEEIGKFEPLEPAREIELAQRVKQGDAEALNERPVHGRRQCGGCGTAKADMRKGHFFGIRRCLFCPKEI